MDKLLILQEPEHFSCSLELANDLFSILGFQAIDFKQIKPVLD
jgi:hypothetical protein